MGRGDFNVGPHLPDVPWGGWCWWFFGRYTRKQKYRILWGTTPDQRQAIPVEGPEQGGYVSTKVDPTIH